MDLQTNSIKELLSDVNHFLSQTLCGEPLSENAAAVRAGLLQRLALHLSPPYLDMNGTGKGADRVEEYVDVNTSSQGHDDDIGCYEEFPEPHEIPSKPHPQEDKDEKTVNYENVLIPITKLRQEAKKFGPLYRKEKFLFMDHLIRCWAGVTHDMLLVYSNERDTKPSSIVTVRGYVARPAPSYYPKDSKKRNFCFEIVCPGKKSHQFIARTVKDMEQWISSINDASQRHCNTLKAGGSTQVTMKRRLPSLPRSSSDAENEDGYDDIHAINEEIYHDITDLIRDSQPSTEKEEAPAPSPPPKDNGSEESVYDDVGFTHPSNVYYNILGQMTDPGTESLPGVSSTQTGVVEPHAQQEEEIYDDIGIIDKTLKQPKSMFKQDSTNSLGRIHHIIQKMEATIGSGKRNSVCNRNKSELNQHTSDSSIPSEELYEPIDNPGEDNSITDSKPELPPRTNSTRF